MKGEGVKWQEGLSPEKLASKNPALIGLADVGSGAKHVQYKKYIQNSENLNFLYFLAHLKFWTHFRSLIISNRIPWSFQNSL